VKEVDGVREDMTFRTIYCVRRSNFDIPTNICCGVIGQNAIKQGALNDFKVDFGDPRCPKCGRTVADITSSLDDETMLKTTQYGGHGFVEYYCTTCDHTLDESDCLPDDSSGLKYTRNEYEIYCLDSYLIIAESPYYMWGQVCSPCVPGAGCLETTSIPAKARAKCYCLGHDWFDDDIAPYPVFRVKDGKEEVR
jgi:hypothetical protein